MTAPRPQQIRLFSLLLMLAMTVAALPSIGGAPVAHAAPAPLSLQLTVEGIDPKRPNDPPTPITEFKYLIVRDNVGDNSQPRSQGCDRASNPDYPAGCEWTSIRSQTGYAPIVTQGDNSDFVGGVLNMSPAGPGDYMISITPAGAQADQFKIDGGWFSLSASGDGAALTVQLNKLDLPSATLRAVVFNDNRSTNGQPDLPAEMGITGTAGAPGEAGDQEGLPGFRITVNDTLGEITTDVFGNPICTVYQRVNGALVYDADGAPIPTGQQINGCLYTSDGTARDLGDPSAGPLLPGQVAIPNMGPNRYTMLATPPDGTSWVQTATLEGNHDWDVWVQEGSTGYDTEFAVAGEPFPWVPFGFVQPSANPSAPVYAGATGGVTGSVAAVTVYTPGVGGIPYAGSIWAGLSGAKYDKPIENPWVAIADLNNGDQTVWVGQGDANGNFTVNGLRDGTYQISWWDTDQLYLLDWQQVDVKNGQITDVGQLHLTAWYAHLSGRVCTDTNYDGICQDSEPGNSGFALAVKRRTNSLIDRGSQGAVTDAFGNYTMDSVYPLTAWLVIEAYSDTYYTTGATYWADNFPIDPATGQPERRYIQGAGVDVNFLSIIGQNGHLDWAVQRYNALPFKRYVPGTNNTVEIPQNGGIVGTVSYDTTRNELNPREAAVENWQVGIPGLNVDLYKPVACVPATFVSAGGTTCVQNPTGSGYYVANADGSLQTGQLINRYVTESWQRPQDCESYGPNGNRLDPGFFKALPLNDGAGRDCLEGPMVGTQFGTEYATVDGNYGFTESCVNRATGGTPAPGQADPANPGECLVGAMEPLTAGDYLVKVNVPDDAWGKPQYQVTREEDINVFKGDSYTPQVAPPACVGKLHTVDVAGIGNDGPGAVDNPTFAEMGGSPFEGQQKPLCDTKLVTLGNGRSVAPSFTFFTDVPLPGRWFGYIVDDLNLSSNPQDLLFGEKAGVANSPIGIYDYANRLVRTISSDPNGVFEVLLPSTTTISCPTPTGVCANLYRIVGNDPGIPGRLNPNYNPSFRTISATFEIFPGDIEPADLAPTQIGVSIQAPGSQLSYPATCRLDATQPQLFAVDTPVFSFGATEAERTITIKGQGFGAAAGKITLSRVYNNQPYNPSLIVSSWTDNQIVAVLPATNAYSGNSQVLPGIWQLNITNASSGLSLVNGLTIHVLQNGVYNPTLLTVQEPGVPILANRSNRNYPTIQEAIDHASTNTGGNSSSTLIVVFPGGVPDSTNPAYNPQRAYFENLIVDRAVRLQGVGPGGVYLDAQNNNVTVDGSIIDGSAFVGDTALSNAWRTRVADLFNTTGWLGNPNIYEGAVITAVAPRTNTYSSSRPLVVDGFKIQGGNQQGFPGNLTEIYGLPNGAPVTVETQGGGLYANAYVDYLNITNNIFQSNGGAYGGAVRIGSPSLPGLANDGQNDRTAILHNRFIANGGTNLAGAIGLFSGTQNYDVGYNDLCGNFSAEYGGAISHYGLNGGTNKIHDNRIYFNRSYDEGGAVMIAGELPTDPTANYGTANGAKGAGNVDIYNNLIQANLSNDDGGGIRFLMAGNYTYNVYNNIIANNIATHEGGGVAIDDAPNIRFYNNTVMKNITTATAVTSDGSPAAAGLSTTMNSDQLQATLTGSPALFSNPLLFNNIFWDNRAGTFNGSDLTGIGANGPADIANWDMAVMGGNGGERLSPTNSLMQATTSLLDGQPSIVASGTNLIGADPQVVDGSYDVSILVLPWRVMPGAGAGQTLVALDLPPNLLGNYHLAAGSPAINLGATAKGGRSAPTSDIDGDARTGNPDAGADEFGGAGGGGPATPALPTLASLDNFNRNNANNLNQGSPNNVSWVQPNSNLRVNNNQAYASSTGQAVWNGTLASGPTFGSTQGAAFTFANTTLNGAALILKASGGTSPSSFIRVRYETTGGGRVVVATTANGQSFNPTYTTLSTFSGVSFASGDTLSAAANADGSVDVWKTSGGTTTYVGRSATSGFTGSGRVGMQLPTGARVDNFAGGTIQ